MMSEMTQKKHKIRHVIAALVTNEPGVLANVAGMFAARGFNIDSLVVGRTENPGLSRMTIVVNGNDSVLEQVRKQLQKLVPVVKVVDYKDVGYIERDLILVQVSTSSGEEEGGSEGDSHADNRTQGRSQLIELATLFRAKVVDVSADRLMIELAGTEEKVEAFIELVRPYGIVELARTGVIAMPRGKGPLDQDGSEPTMVQNPAPGSAVDDSDLPPG